MYWALVQLVVYMLPRFNMFTNLWDFLQSARHIFLPCLAIIAFSMGMIQSWFHSQQKEQTNCYRYLES